MGHRCWPLSLWNLEPVGRGNTGSLFRRSICVSGRLSLRPVFRRRTSAPLDKRWVGATHDERDVAVAEVILVIVTHIADAVRARRGVYSGSWGHRRERRGLGGGYWLPGFYLRHHHTSLRRTQLVSVCFLKVITAFASCALLV